jgi:ATP-binding cassette subfamily B protein
MDCGPAALKSLLEGFGISASYGRLREACQTEVDGTSIDALEDIAGVLGLQVEQVMIPVDHVLLDEARAVPALTVVRLPNGFAHFVVLWRRHGSLLQVMDPASGRRWVPRETFLRDLFVHETSVPVEAFEEWALSEDFGAPLSRRMQNLGLGAPARTRLLQAARSGGWRALAALDASVRTVASLARSGALPAKGGPERTLAALLADESAIPAKYFTARPAPDAPDGEARVRLRGAVMLRVNGGHRVSGANAAALTPDLARALAEAPAHAARELTRMVLAGGWTRPAALVFALACIAVGALVEAMLFRACLDLPRQLATVYQRLGAAAALIVFVAAIRGIGGSAAAGSLRIGRQLETRLRRAFLEKLPRLNERYFQSRSVSDMAERAHALHEVQRLPELVSQVIRAVMELGVTAVAIGWLDRASFLPALAACAIAVLIPVAWQPALGERDLRVRSHRAGLARFDLDALLGMMPIRTHGAEVAVRREHESLVVEWARAARALARASAWADAIQSLATTMVVAWMIYGYTSRVPDASGVLLIAYWGLNIPFLGDEIAAMLGRYPAVRNITLRLLEPLGAPEGDRAPEAPAAASAPGVEADGVAIAMTGVRVVAAGHEILRDVDLRIDPAEHVAIVGASGAGKSTLVGLLLGWHRASAGAVRVDGAPLDAERLQALRHCTAWVDPAVRIWNQSLLENLRYGADPRAAGELSRVLEEARIQPLLGGLEHGLQTALGEGGALVSGGEGQRVRLGRAMMRPSARLVILDEAFRGLQRDQRRELLARTRAYWKRATLLCVTHDVSETTTFDRVLVVDGGRVLEDGNPAELALDSASSYAAMLRAEQALLEQLWGGPEWRRLRLDGGLLRESGRPNAATDGGRRAESP